MGKATELIQKIRENFEDVSAKKLTESEIDKMINDELALLTEAELDAEVMEALEGCEDINEAKSTFPKAKQIKSMQIILKKIKKAVAPLRSKSEEITQLINRNTRGKGPGAKNAKESPKARQVRLRKMKAWREARAKIQADMDKQFSLASRAHQQLDKLNKERKEFNKKRASDSKKAKKTAPPAKKAA